MKRILAICLAVFISVSVSAGSEIYIEKFISSERAHLSNLTVVPSMGSAILGFGEDIPGFGLKDSTARFGEIRYQVRGASQMTIKFYSANSSFACRASNNQWRLGMPDPDYNGEMLPVYMDPTGALYIHDGVTWRQHQKVGTDPWTKPTFNPVSWAPESTIPLNMNVSVTDSSGHTKALSGSSTKPYPKLSSGKSIIGYYEERTYTIPDNARELVIELNFPWENRDASGNPTGNGVMRTNYPVVVTQIQMEGEHLIFDQKDPDPEESSSSSGSSGGGESTGGGDEDHSDDEIILPDNDPENTQEDRVEMPVSSEESSSQSSGSSEGKSSSSKSSSGSKKSSSGSKQPEEPDRTSSEPESETLIYQTDKDSVRDKLFYLMLAGYGVIGLGIAWQIYRHTIRRK